MAAHMQMLVQSPENISTSISCGIASILAAVMHFTSHPRNITDSQRLLIIREGLSLIGDSLYQCEVPLLPRGDLLEIEQSWRLAFDGLGGALSDEVIAYLTRFMIDGDVPSLVLAISAIFGKVVTVTSLLIAPETSALIIKYLNALIETIQALGTSWAAWAMGRTVDGIASLYSSLRTMTDVFIPNSTKNGTIYRSVIGPLDYIMSTLSSVVFRYTRSVMEANVCWRVEVNRGVQRPQVCPPRYYWDGQAFCYPLVRLLQSSAMTQLRKRAEGASGVENQPLDLAATAKKPKGNGGSYPHLGAIPASCDISGQYPEKNGQFCYSSCGVGFQVAQNVGRCITSCIGEFPAESPQMCGRDPGVLTLTILEMTTIVTNSAFSVADTFVNIKSRGMDPTVVTSTINTFINAGIPFANPTCPVQTSPTASAPSAPSPMPTRAPMQCAMGVPIYLTSYHGKQLQDNYGKLQFSTNRLLWERWTFSNASDKKFFITSYRGQQLQDYNGQLQLSTGMQEMAMWVVTGAGNGKAFISSYRQQQLTDGNGNAGLVWNSDAWETWAVTGENGAPACTR